MQQLSHDSLIFNLHDLILLMAIGQYLLLAVLVFFTRQKNEKSSLLLISILIANAVQSLDTLIIWSDQLRHIVLHWQANAFFWGGLAYWLQGPLLYWYVSSVLYKDFTFTPRSLLHFIPLLIVTLLLSQSYYALPIEEQVRQMENLDFMWATLAESIVSTRYLSVMIYGAYCLYEITHYRKQLRHQYANIEQGERSWLWWIVIGVLFIATWSLIIHLLGNSINYELSNFMGIGTNYFTFIFVNSLVFISIRYTHIFDGLSSQQTQHETSVSKKEEIKAEHIQRVEQYMKNEKPYLEANINLERLAHRLSLPQRTLSRVVNHHYHKNFFEFINTYRVEEAKRLLADEKYRGKTIIDILAEAGFSSKSAFNLIFKQQVGKTPTQYRKKALAIPK